MTRERTKKTTIPVRKSVVYAMQCGTTGRVKIGRTDRLDYRLRQIQTACPTDISLIGTLICPEREAHVALGAYRLHGEWFEGVAPVRLFIASRLASKQETAA